MGYRVSALAFISGSCSPRLSFEPGFRAKGLLLGAQSLEFASRVLPTASP